MDLLLVQQRMGDRAADLATIIDCAPITENAETYAREVRKAAALRSLSSSMVGLQQKASSPETSADDILRELHAVTKTLDRAVSVGTGGLPAPVQGGDELENTRRELAEQEAGRRLTLDLPWPRLSDQTRMLRPGSVCLLGAPAGAGKSFFATSIAIHVNTLGEPWAYLPLEGAKADLIWRLFAIIAQDYRMIEDKIEDAEWRLSVIEAGADVVSGIASHIWENPRVGRFDAAGNVIVPELPFDQVVDWARGVATDGARVIFLDPVSQIDFGSYRSFDKESEFVRKLNAVAIQTRSTIFLVCHTVKRPGAKAAVPLSLEDFQGSASYGRLCDAAIMMEAHDWKESRIYRSGGGIEEVRHNKTIVMAKTRHGAGTRKRIAFVQGVDGPTFEEIGMIAPKSVGDDGSPF